MSMRVQFSWIIIVVALSSWGRAQEKGDSPIKGAENAAKSRPATISVDQEKDILAFVSKNDTSLHGLLGNLKAARPMEYQRALLDLNRVTERLAQIKRNRPHAYDLELQKWQTQSKVQVLAAQLAMNPNPAIKAELRQAIELRADLELQVLRADREAATKRLKMLEEQIAAAESNRNSRVQQQFDRSITTASRANGGPPKKRPAFEGKKPATKAEIPTGRRKKKERSNEVAIGRTRTAHSSPCSNNAVESR